MNRFRFRLRSVLRFREIIEENKKRVFGIALDHLKHEETRYDLIANQINGQEKFMEQKGEGKVSSRDLRNNFNYVRHLDRNKESLEKQVEKAKENLESKRTELVEATKRKKILERLKERDREDHNKAVRKEEQAIIDDISTQHFNNPHK